MTTKTLSTSLRFQVSEKEFSSNIYALGVVNLGSLARRKTPGRQDNIAPGYPEITIGEVKISDRPPAHRRDIAAITLPDHENRVSNGGGQAMPPVPSVPPISAVPFAFANGHLDPTYIPAPEIFVVEDEDEVVERLFPQEQPDVEDDPVPIPPTIAFQPDGADDVQQSIYKQGEISEFRPASVQVIAGDLDLDRAIVQEAALLEDSAGDAKSHAEYATPEHMLAVVAGSTPMLVRPTPLENGARTEPAAAGPLTVGQISSVDRAGENSRETLRRLVLSLVICTPVAILATFLAGPLARAVAPREAQLYAEVGQVAVWAIPLLAVLLPMESALRVAGKHRLITRNRVLTTLLSITLTAGAIWSMGSRGAGYAVVASVALSLVFVMPAFARAFPEVFRRLPVFRMTAGVLMAIAVLGYAASLHVPDLAQQMIWVAGSLVTYIAAISALGVLRVVRQSSVLTSKATS